MNAIYDNMSGAMKGISTSKANCAEETKQIAVSAMPTNAHVVQLSHTKIIVILFTSLLD